MSFPYLAKSTLKYKSPHATDLSFAKDEKIRVTGQSDDDEDWLLGESLDGSRSGGFPKDFVTPIEEEDESVTEAAAPAPVLATQPEPEAEKETADPAPPVPADAPPPPSPKLDPTSLPQSPAPVSTPAPAAPAPVAVSTPAPSQPTPTKAPAAAPAASTDSGDQPDPSQMTMKDRLAFFAAAQGKAGPPPPIKPKPASGLTWSQRQKLRQEEEAKEKEAGGSTTTEAPVPTPAAAPAAVESTPAPSSPRAEKREAAGLSAADAQTSIGKGGSLKERMAALQGAGAFGQGEETSKSTPPAPSGKVWKRPAAPEPTSDDEVDEDGAAMKSPTGEEGDGLLEAGEQEGEKTEEEEEKARKAAIAARMAKLGNRGPMAMAIPPKPARKPTRESIASPTSETKPDELAAPMEDLKLAEPSSPTAATSPPTSVPMPAIARRTAPPRRRGPPSSSAVPTIASTKETTEDQSMSIGPNDGAEPPPQVMVHDEEKPLPKTEEQKAQEKEFEEAGQKPGGAGGAAAAGIALAPVNTEGAAARSAQEDDDEDEDDTMEDSRGGEAGVGSPVQAPQMVPIHPPADSPMIETDETPPPPPPRMNLSSMPKDEIEMKHQEEQEAAEENEEDDEANEGQDEEGEDEAPPPPQRDVRRSIGGGDKPLGPRPLPSPGKVGIAPPLPPMVPPRDDSEDEKEMEQEEDEAPPPPPPARKPSVPVPARLQMPSESPSLLQSPTSPRAAQSPVPRSPTTPMRAVPPAPVEEEVQGEDDEATRRKNIAARMAKLGGIKFGAPPQRSNSTGPTSAGGEGPKSPIRETPTSPTVEEEQDEMIPRGSAQPPLSPGMEGGDGEETAEEEAARRRATLARLRAGGSLGFGMFGQRGHDSSAASDERGLETEEVQEEEIPPVPAGRPAAPQSPTVSKVPEVAEDEEDAAPPPPARPNASHNRSTTAQSESDFAPPPVPGGRPPAPPNRLPPPPINTEQDYEDAPPPPPRSAQPLSPGLPQSPARPPIPSADKRMSQLQQPRSQELPPPIDRQMTDEPGGMEDIPPPPPARPQSGSPIMPASPRRSTSIASRSSGQPVMPPASRQGSRMDEQPRSSVSQSRPGFDQLQEASKVHGTQLIRAAKAMFSQGKNGYLGDGSPAGFVLTAMDNAHLPKPQGQWGFIILEQEGTSVLKRSDEPRPGDIAAFYDAKLKGKKGLSSYTQNVGSVEEPLVGIVSESETKKHKLRVLQVERGVPEEVSYRCDDLKSGRVVVFRPGV